MDGLHKECPHCEMYDDLDAQYCSHCGYQFYQDGEKDRIPIPDKRFKGYLLTDIKACVGKKYDVYIEKFTECRRRRHTFNWCMALFGAYWMCYRKMWRYLGWILGLSMAGLVLSSVVYLIWLHHVDFYQLTNDPQGFLSGLTLISLLIKVGLFIIRGSLGDPLYWRTVKRQLDTLNCCHRPAVYDPNLARKLERIGGTLSVGETIGLIIGLDLAVWLVQQIFAKILTSYSLSYLERLGV